MTSELRYPRFSACLSITGEHLDPDDISARTGLAPTRSARRGDPIVRPRATLTQRYGLWKISSTLSEERPLMDHVDSVLLVLAPASSAIASLGQEFDVWFSCIVYAERPPELTFSCDHLRAIASMGASLDIDLYHLVGD